MTTASSTAALTAQGTAKRQQRQSLTRRLRELAASPWCVAIAAIAAAAAWAAAVAGQQEAAAVAASVSIPLALACTKANETKKGGKK
jgi:hypothetical protein